MYPSLKRSTSGRIFIHNNRKNYMQENLRRGYNLVSLRLLFQYIHIMWQLTIGIMKPINTIPPIKGFFQMLFYNLVIYLKIPKPWNHVHYCVQRQYICYQNYQGSEITGRKINHISSLCQLMLILLVIKQNLCLKWDKLNSLLDKLYRYVVTLYDLICYCINVQK